MHVRVAQLAVTAVKGFGMRSVGSVVLGPTGAEGDRDFLLVDENDRLFSVTRSGAFASYWAIHEHDRLQIGRGPDVLVEHRIELSESIAIRFDRTRTVPGRLVAGPWNDVVSDLAGQVLRLVKAEQPSGAVDVEPLTILGLASAAALGEEPSGSTVDPLRFRMLLNLEGTEPFEEDGWRGQRLGVGDAVIQVLGPVPRCAATLRHPGTGERDLDTLHRIREVRGVQPHDAGRGLNLGVYAVVVRPGRISRGDLVQRP